MMTTPLSTVALVQNPALGALLLWRFGKSYQEVRLVEAAQLHSFFVVLPLLYHAPTLDCIRSTYESSGLSQFTKKLGEERELLIAVQERALKMRELTLSSVGTAISSGLMHLSYDTGRLRSNEARPPKPPERLKYHVAGADKLGRWFGRLSLDQAFALLWVEP
ncbi:three component ABC system middle component [Agrobacterium sp. CFBP2214]|uniref:three component ABC system middle component n=1 Tax=Agrobacterium sp. CFBP2214 TaxID=3040274 RepID=UPI00101A3F0C|nr:three component ABC system middle component [Agrobacterium sp. CFBP2214]